MTTSRDRKNQRELHKLGWKVITFWECKISNKDVDISRLRIVCSRSPAPIQLCYSELGTQGPILGTIHASKGREAENVILRLPFRPANAQEFNYGEESRVLYVGATRAKGELSFLVAAHGVQLFLM